jgi:hypothetical protein
VGLGQPPLEIAALVSELERARANFRRAAESLTEVSWNRPSANPQWTNGQMMFHVLLAFMLLPYLVPLARFFGRLPPAWSKPLAASLDLATPIFNWVNGLGPRGAATVFSRVRVLRRYDALHDYAIRALTRTRVADLERGMHYPRRWDPMFRGYMTLGDVFRYPAIHMAHHMGQIVP